MTVLEITVQRGSGGAWPVVVEHSRPDALSPIRKEGELRLGDDEQRRLIELELDPRAYGEVLGGTLFAGRTREAFLQAKARDPDGLRVRLFVEDKELQRLYWGRLCEPVDDDIWDFLARDPRSTFALYLPSSTDLAYRPIGQRDLRALLVVAEPEGLSSYGLAEFDAAATVASLRAALGTMPCEVLAAVPGADGLPTLDELCQRLGDGQHTLLHMVAHGQVKDGETYLFLANERNQAERVAGEALIRELRRLAQLPHFIFLATCHSAQPKAGLGGLAQRLVTQLGVPAAIAMTEAVSIDTAGALATAFYSQLRTSGEPDLALAKACAGLTRRPDIAVPALYSRLGDRPLFSDTLDRELTPAEVATGLNRLEALLPERAPVLVTDFKQSADRLRGMLSAGRENLAEAARPEWDKAWAAVSKTCDEVLDLNFRALALGREPPPYDPRCPFLGLYPFLAGDRAFFFGREALVEQLRQKLVEHNFLAVLGASGCGKSSLVIAGLVPVLQEQDKRLASVYLTPGNDPLAQLETGLARSSRPRIVVADQFEELFTLCSDEGKRRAFLDRILTLTGDDPVIITMRADFWGDCAPYGALKEAMLARQELIAPMDAVELRSAVEQQAKVVGLRFEADLVNTILDAVRGEPGAMPLLQHALLELWKRRHGRWLLAREYRALGGVQQAIARTADDFYDRLTVSEQKHVRSILVRLTRLDEDAVEGEDRRDTRRRVSLAELVPIDGNLGMTSGLVQRLANERLAVTSMNKVTNTQEVEVAHEALIQYWRRLHLWLDEDREMLRLREGVRRAAIEWASNGQVDEFLDHKGRRLEKAEALLNHPRVTLNTLELTYLKACLAVQGTTQAQMTQQLIQEAEARWKRFETGVASEYLQIRIFARQPEGYLMKLLLASDPQRFPTVYLDPNTLPLKAIGELAQVGERLFDWLFADMAVRDAWTNTVAESQLRLIRLWIEPGAAELQGVCWELLRDTTPKTIFRELAGSLLTPFVRYLPGQWQPGGPTLQRPLKILVAISDPSDLSDPREDEPSADSEWESLCADLVGLPVTLTRVPPPCSLSAIERELQRGYHVLHFIGCASYYEASNRTAVSLPDQQNHMTPVDGSELVAMFTRQSQHLSSRWDDKLRLISLNGHRIGNASDSALAFRALAIDLVMAGVPAVLAMQERLPPRAEAEFTRDFYQRLLQSGRVDLAANMARSGLLAAQVPANAIPVCFTRLRSGLLLAQSQIVLAEEQKS